MKYSKNMLLVVCCAGLALGQPKGAAAPARSTSAKSSRAADSKAGSNGPYKVPKDAVEVEPGIFEAKDAQGKVWHYASTPFGVRRFEPQKHGDTTALEASVITVAGQEDGVVRFERRTPFGVSKWSKKKDELTPVEKIAVERAAAHSKDSRGGPAATAAAKPVSKQ
jgi:hypothetical protein